MAQDMGKVNVVCDSPEEVQRMKEEEQYTVPIPEGLTEDFEPSQPVSVKQYEAWGNRHIEPYPGFADELEAWERAWQDVEIAQLKADGEPVLEMDPVHIYPAE